MKKRQAYALLSLVLIVSVSSCYAQKRSTQRLKEDVDLPADFSIDFKLAAANRLTVQNEIAERKSGSKVIVTFMHIAWVMNATLTVPDPRDNLHYSIYYLTGCK